MYAEAGCDRFLVGGTSLGFESAGGRRWDVLGEQIRCLGESTAESPTGGEDWTLCVILDLQGAWIEGSLFAAGRNDALQWLSIRLGCSLELKLANGSPFRSRVMWPIRLADQPLFNYQISPFRRYFSRTCRRLGLRPAGGIQTVRPEILRHLWRAPWGAAADPIAAPGGRA